LDAFQWKAATGFRKIGYVKVSASAWLGEEAVKTQCDFTVSTGLVRCVWNCSQLMSLMFNSHLSDPHFYTYSGRKITASFIDR
jgi:hypothetical protein